MNLFNERSKIWIKCYKIIAIVLFFIFAGLGLIGGICDCFGIDPFDIGLGGDDDGLLDLLVWIIVGGGFAFFQLVSNMLIIQLLNNIQIIRKKVEKM